MTDKQILDLEEKEWKAVFKDLQEMAQLMYDFFSAQDGKYPGVKVEIVRLVEQVNLAKVAFYKSLPVRKRKSIVKQQDDQSSLRNELHQSESE